jgi:hypothetical protein
MDPSAAIAESPRNRLLGLAPNLLKASTKLRFISVELLRDYDSEVTGPNDTARTAVKSGIQIAKSRNTRDEI